MPPAFVNSLLLRPATSTLSQRRISSIRCPHPNSRQIPGFSVPRRASFTMIVQEAKAGRVLYIKAAPDGSVGDCPFSQKANLALHFRAVQFETGHIDLSNKPEFFLKLNEDGTTPVWVDGDQTVADSAAIVKLAGQMGTGPQLILESHPHWDEASELVSSVFPAFVGFLKNKEDDSEEEKRNKLADVLRSLDSFLKSVPGPFLLGRDVSGLDCDLAPKIKHISVATPHYKQFYIPEECDAVKDYIAHFQTLNEWKPTACRDDVIISGWSKFFK